MRKPAHTAFAALAALWIGMFPISARALVLCVDHDGHIALEAYCSPGDCSAVELCDDGADVGGDECAESDGTHDAHSCNDFPFIGAVEGKSTMRIDGTTVVFSSPLIPNGAITMATALRGGTAGAIALARPSCALHLSSTILRL